MYLHVNYNTHIYVILVSVMHVELTEILINVPNRDYMSYFYKLYNTCPYHLIIISNNIHIYITKH